MEVGWTNPAGSIDRPRLVLLATACRPGQGTERWPRCVEIATPSAAAD
jgi:hypothetical protein